MSSTSAATTDAEMSAGNSSKATLEMIKDIEDGHSIELMEEDEDMSGLPDLADDPDPSENHLSYPAVDTSPLVSDSNVNSLVPASRPLLVNKLYVGNLSPTVDEYTLLRVFSRFGKITNLDYLFHKSGPLRGKPRGYAFVEYGDAGDATKALNATHHKLLRGRRIVVTHAQQAPMDAFGSTPQHKSRRIMADSGRPTTLSILKSASGGRKNETKDKIAMMEAKLHQMEQTKTLVAAHPSLPAKPAPPLPAHVVRSLEMLKDRQSSVPRNTNSGTSFLDSRPKSHRPTSQLPSLPIQLPKPALPVAHHHYPSVTTKIVQKKPGLAGVKIVKPKMSGPAKEGNST